MKYFKHKGLDYHCDNIFNWVAVDADGSLWLYEKEPHIKECAMNYFTRQLITVDYWTSGHSDSYDYQVAIDNQTPCRDWKNTLREL